MSQLNDFIKCIVMLHNIIMAILALFVLFLGGMVWNGMMKEFDPESWGDTASYVVGVSALILVATVLGCCGAYRQVNRKGKKFVHSSPSIHSY